MPSEWNDRFRVIVECKDCGAQGEMVAPQVGNDLVNGFHRLVLIGAPEVCKVCKNLKVTR